MSIDVSSASAEPHSTETSSQKQSTTLNTSDSSHHDAHSHTAISLAGMLISIGIVFGDIGTSPLYAYSAILGGNIISRELALGAFSAIFWTLTLQTTLKYVLITLRADNKGEGGIFSLYALIRKYVKGRFMLPAIIGGSFLLADGIITPPITVSSAIEGLRVFDPHLNTVAIVIGILIALFTVQQFGTDVIGKSFGPIMLLWFGFIGVMGGMALVHNLDVLHALNPYYAYWLIAQYPSGFWLLGAVFLCTTGAEALYSDMGHCGRGNIRISWLFVKTTLLLSYAGQTAWALSHVGESIGTARPFFAIIPEPLLVPSIIIATLAAIIASQALISGSYTLINEAMRLDMWLRFKVVYPTNIRGQLYVPRLNWMLMMGCIGVVLYFQESTKMEAAYGLAVTLTMLMTTILMTVYLRTQRVHPILTGLIVLPFFLIELCFLVANGMKIMHGGWISLLIGAGLMYVMYVYQHGRELKRELTKYEPLAEWLPRLRELSNDTSVAKYASNLVYLTASSRATNVERDAIHSIFRKGPKRADIYWFVHVNVVDEPFATRFRVKKCADNDVIWLEFNLGFRIEPRVNLFFRLAVEQLTQSGEIDITSRYESLGKDKHPGDFRFVIFERFLSFENDFRPFKKLMMNSYYLFNRFSVNDKERFGLDKSNIDVEKVTLVYTAPKHITLIRENDIDRE